MSDWVITPPPPVVLITKGNPDCDHKVVVEDRPTHEGFLGVVVAGYRLWSCLTCGRTVRQAISEPPKPKLRMPEPT